MKNICKHNGFIYVPRAMNTKAFIFAMEMHANRANLIYLSPPTLKLRGATLAELE